MAGFRGLESDNVNTATDITAEQQVELGLEPKVKSKIAWFSRKSKANSVALDEKDGVFLPRNEGNGRYRNSMPVDISSFESCGMFDSQELMDDHESPELYIKTVREELDALKGFVAERRSLFSPSHSPEPQVNDMDPLTAVANELVAEYSSSSESIVQPLNEYSVQVPPFQTSESQNTALPIIRQESLEYDHLEAKEEGVTQEEDCPDGFNDGGTCFVTLQYVEDKCESEVISCDGSPQRKRSVVSVTDKIVRDNCYFDDSAAHNCVHAQSPYRLQHREQISSSIPGRLDSPSLMKSPLKHCNLLSQQQWSSTLYIRDERKENCHCPACCSCGSSQRRLPASASFELKSSPAMQNCLAHTCNAGVHTLPRSVRSCPLKRYTRIMPAPSIHTSKSHSLQRKQSSSTVVAPVISEQPDISETAPSTSDADNRSGMYSSSYIHDVDSESVHSVQSATTQSSCCYSHSRTLYNQGVDGSIFKERMQEQCSCVQMHLLSMEMEPILHQTCPHNCQDLLLWLPPSITYRILSFLDPVSLCHASQVNHYWYIIANDPKIWKALCFNSKWILSPCGQTKQLASHTQSDGTVQWKLMFAERYRLRRNWLKGYCTVRTFEGHSQGISCVQFDDTRIVSGSWDKTIKVWNRRTNTAWAALTLAGHSGTVRCLHLHDNRLVSGSSDRTIKVWDLATNHVGWIGATCKMTMVGHLHTVRCLQADDKKVVSGSYDHTLKVWDMSNGQCTMTLRGHTDAVLCLQFDNEKVISGSKDTTIKVWRLSDGLFKMTLRGHEGAVTCLQFDDSRIISGALDRLIKIWSLSTGQCLRSMDWIKSEGHTGVVRHLQADSWKIVSAADDKTLKVWSVQSGERLLTLKSHTDGVTCLQLNDQVIVSGSYDKSVKLWDFSVC